MVGTAAEVSAVSSVDDRPIPCPGPMTKEIGEEYGEVVRGKVDKYKTWVELCTMSDLPSPRRDLRHDAPRRGAVRGDLAHRRGQAQGRRAARLARRRLDRGRLPAGQPEGRGVLPARRHRARRWRRPTLVAFGSTRRPAGKVDVDPTLAGAGEGRHVHGVHRRQELGLPRRPRRSAPPSTRAWRWWASSVEFLEGRGPAGVLRRRALLRRLQGQPRVRAARAGGGRHQRRRRASCCATPTAARCPHEVQRIVGEVHAYFGPTSSSASTPRTTPAARWPTFDTTLRDGAQFEGISLTVEDKLKVAEQLDWLGVAWIEGGYPHGEPEGRGVLPRAPSPSSSWRPPPSWPSAPPAGPPARSTSTRRCEALVKAGTSTVCIVGKSWDFHVSEALGTTLDEGVAMVGESVEFLKAAGLRVFFDAEHFFDGYKANPEYALRVLEAAATNGADVLVLLRHQRRLAAPRGAAHRHRGARLLRRPAPRHPHPERHRLRGGQLGRRRGRRRHPAAGHGQRLRRAHRQRQPHDLHPQPRAEDGHQVPARGPARAAHRGEPPRGRAGEPAAALGRPVRRPERLRPQGRAAHLRARQGRRRHLRAHRARGGRQRHPRAGERPRRPGRHGDEGQGARRRPRRPRRRQAQRRPQAARGRGLRVRGGRRQPRAPHAPGHRLVAGLLPRRGLPRHHLPPGARRRAATRRPSTPRPP